MSTPLRARIQPQLGALEFASITYPTLLGPIELDVKQQGGSHTGHVTIPEGMTTELILPGKKAPVELQAGKHRF